MTESGLWDEYENVEHVLPPELWLSSAGKIHARDCPHLSRADDAREIGAEAAGGHALCRRCFGQPLALASQRPDSPVEEADDDGDGDARLGEVPDIVVTSTHSSIVHAPSAESATEPKCVAGRGGSARRVSWDVVAPTHSLCSQCFSDSLVGESPNAGSATGD